MNHGPNRFLAGICLAGSFLFAVYLGALGVVLPTLGEAFGLGTSVQGRLFPASFGGSVGGVLACGWLSDRVGRKPVLLLCLGVALLGFLLFGAAGAFPLVLAGALCVGAGGAAGQTVSSALLSDLFPARRAFFINAMQVAFGAGAILGPALMVGAVGSPSLGWRPFYFALAGAYAALLVALLVAVPHRAARADGGDGAAAGQAAPPPVRLLRERPLLLLCASAFLYAGAEVALFSWMPTYLQTLPGGSGAAGWAVSVFWVMMTLGRLATGALLTRTPLVRLRLWLAVGAALAGTLTLLLPSPALILAGVGLTGLCLSGIFSLLLAEGGERYPRAAGAALSLIVATSGAGAGLLPFAVGLLRAGGASWPVALSLVPLAALLVAGIALASGTPARKGVKESPRAVS